MMADVKRFMFLLIDTVGLLVDRTRVVAGFNHNPPTRPGLGGLGS